MDVSLEEMFSGVDAEVEETEEVSEEVAEVEIPKVDESEAEVVKETPKTTKKSVPAKKSESTQVQESGVGNDFSIDMPDSLKSSLADVGIEVGDIGMKVSRVPIEKYKASASKVDRIGFITQKVIPVKYHFIDGVGSILCTGGKCCELQGSPTIRYLFPIVEYQTDAEGNVTGGKVALKMLSAGEDLYKSIQTINKGSMSQGGIDHVDLLVTCTDEHFQKITLVQAGEALWRKFSAVAEFLKNKWMQDGDKSYMAVARKVDDETLMRLLDMDTSDETPQTVDMSQNQDLSKFFS
jgi:hypothetical protein